MTGGWITQEDRSGWQQRAAAGLVVREEEVAGGIGFVGGEHPAGLRQSEIDEIRARIEAANGKEVPKVQYSVGEEVKINDGPFLNFSGVIEEIEPERGKLKVTVNIFGRNTPVELEYWQVEKA